MIRRIALLVVFSLLLCAGVQAQYLNAKITEKKTVLHKAVILPPKVEITKQSAKGAEMMVAESETTSTRVAEVTAAALKEKNVTIVDSPFSNLNAEGSADLKYALANIQSRYDDLLPKLLKKSGDVKKGRFSLGDEVMLLNAHKTADVLVFIRGQGTVFTKGKTALAILNPFSFSFPYALITIGIVDARTGEVLVFTKPVTAASVTDKNENNLNKLITKSLKKLPNSQ